MNDKTDNEMSISFSLNKGRISRRDHAAVIESAEAFFQTEKNKSEMPTYEVTYDFVSRLFPYSLNIIKDGKKVVGHTFTLPCDDRSMDDFLTRRITERELFFSIRGRISPEDYSSLYLAAAMVQPAYRGKGLATEALTMQVRAYQNAICDDLALFYWPLTSEGDLLAKKIASTTGLTIIAKKE
jgi:hypothetical protein